MKKIVAIASLVIAGGFGLTACGPKYDYQAFCFDPVNKMHVNDDFCEKDERNYRGWPWAFVKINEPVPQLHTPLAPNSYVLNIPQGSRASFADVDE